MGEKGAHTPCCLQGRFERALSLSLSLSLPLPPSLTPQDVSSDSQLRLTVSKLLKPEQLVLVLLLNNQKQFPVSSVHMTIILPSNIKVRKNS